MYVNAAATPKFPSLGLIKYIYLYLSIYLSIYLERWQGPPHINKAKQCKFSCQFVYSVMKTKPVCLFCLFRQKNKLVSEDLSGEMYKPECIFKLTLNLEIMRCGFILYGRISIVMSCSCLPLSVADRFLLKMKVFKSTSQIYSVFKSLFRQQLVNVVVIKCSNRRT